MAGRMMKTMKLPLHNLAARVGGLILCVVLAATIFDFYVVNPPPD